MRFVIEQLHITDDAGNPIPFSPTKQFHSLEGEDAKVVLLQFVETDGAMVVGDVTLFPGHQAMLTARKGPRIYALHVYPGSDPKLRVNPKT